MCLLILFLWKKGSHYLIILLEKDAKLAKLSFVLKSATLWRERKSPSISTSNPFCNFLLWWTCKWLTKNLISSLFSLVKKENLALLMTLAILVKLFVLTTQKRQKLDRLCLFSSKYVFTPLVWRLSSLSVHFSHGHIYFHQLIVFWRSIVRICIGRQRFHDKSSYLLDEEWISVPNLSCIMKT